MLVVKNFSIKNNKKRKKIFFFVKPKIKKEQFSKGIFMVKQIKLKNVFCHIHN